MSSKIPSIVLITLMVVVLAFAAVVSVSAQDNSTCGWINNDSGTGAFAPTLTVWETNETIDLGLLESEPSHQLMNFSLPGYFRIYDPVFQYAGFMTGFSYIEAVATCEPLPLPTNTPVPPILPDPSPATIPSPYDGPLPNDGFEPGPTWLSQIIQTFVPPVEASSPTDCQSKFTVNNCTWFVASKRPDVCQWIKPGQGNAYQWASQAQQNGNSLGITVKKTPEAGDIAVWSQSCGGTPAGQCSDPEWACGHVAYVAWASSDGKTMKIQEMNWSIDRTDQPVAVLSCMSFIGRPSQRTGHPTPIPTTVPSKASPSKQPSILSAFWKWINIFLNR